MAHTRLIHKIAVLLSLLQGFFVVVNSRCTGYNSPISLSQKSGIILSPLYPNSYSDNEKCRWTLSSPFTHTNYLLVYDVIDIHVSHKRLDGQLKCTGHLDLYDEETDCKTTKPFCKVYYSSKDCAPVALKNYPDCAVIMGTFVPGRVKFTSEHYFPALTPQRGFKLLYSFVDCTKVEGTTTSTTAVTTTPATTSPETTTSAITTERDTTTVAVSTEAATSPLLTTTPLLTTSPVITTSPNNTHMNGTEGAVESTGLATWVYAVIAVGVVIAIVLLIAIIVIRQRRRKSEDINWLMGIENPHYSDLIEKSKTNVAVVARRENNYA